MHQNQMLELSQRELKTTVNNTQGTLMDKVSRKKI